MEHWPELFRLRPSRSQDRGSELQPGALTAVFAPQSRAEPGTRWEMHSSAQGTSTEHPPRLGVRGDTETSSPWPLASISRALTAWQGGQASNSHPQGWVTMRVTRAQCGDNPPCVGATTALQESAGCRAGPNCPVHLPSGPDSTTHLLCDLGQVTTSLGLAFQRRKTGRNVPRRVTVGHRGERGTGCLVDRGS